MPDLSEKKLHKCVDARLEGDYPPKAAAKVLQMPFLSIWSAVQGVLYIICALTFCVFDDCAYRLFV